MDKHNGALHLVLLQRYRGCCKESSQCCGKSQCIKESG